MSRARSGFTLIEVLVVVVIIATMMGVGAVSIRSGQGAARLRGATRDIFASIRHARSVALLTQQPSVISYSETKDGDDIVSVVKLTTAQLMTDDGPEKAKTLAGEEVWLNEDAKEAFEAAKRPKRGNSRKTEVVMSDGVGQSISEILFAPISEEVLRGIRIKVVKEASSSTGVYATEAAEKSRISVFSNSDYILGKYRESKSTATTSAQADESSSPIAEVSSKSGFSSGVVIGKAAEKALAEEPLLEEVSFVCETNGRTEPYQIWIYPEGVRYDKGLSIKVDRFGAARVISPGDD